MSTARARRPGSLEETAFLELVKAADRLSRAPAQILRDADLTTNQYNILRILRGSPDGLSCGEIGERMVTRDPDITRLLDRLERRGLIERWRDEQDRRTVMARVTAAGLQALGRLDEPVQAAHRAQLGHLGRDKLHLLIELLASCRPASK